MSLTPKAVLISDIHFTVPTLELATNALQQAIDKAAELSTQLIVCGDTLDSKAVMRGECVNRLIELFSSRRLKFKPIVMVGNHDLINEKSYQHTLNFLKPYCQIVETYAYEEEYLGAYLIPYISDLDSLSSFFKKIINPESTIIMHQGLKTASMGHYIQDSTALDPTLVENLRVISGHYHKRQTIKCGERGLFDYVGNPYSISFGEANDPLKGYQVLMSDGSLQFIPCRLRRHIVVNWNESESPPEVYATPEDLVWVKITGQESTIKKLTKSQIRLMLELPHNNFKLDCIPLKSNSESESKTVNLTSAQIVDQIIDSIDDTVAQRAFLKEYWKELVGLKQ